MRIKKKIYIFALFTFAILTGCKTQTNIRDGNTYIEPNQVTMVDIKMLVIGNEPDDFSLVLNQVNEILQEEIDVKLSVEFMAPKNLDVQYHSVFAGSSDFDMIQTYPYHYNEYANKRAYMMLTEDMLQKCIPKTIEQEGQHAIEQVRIDNILYMIPSYAYMERQQVAIIRGDLTKTTKNNEIKTFDDIEKYLYHVRYNTDVMPLLIGEDGSQLLDFFYLQEKNIERYDQFYFGFNQIKKNMTWIPEEEYFIDFWSKIHAWKNSGLIPENASSKKAISPMSFYEGDTAMYIGDIYEIENLYRKVIANKPDYAPKIIHLGGSINQYRYPIHHGIALKNGTTNAAKSLQVIELINSNEKIFRLLNYGVLGKHYTIKGDNRYEALGESGRYPIYNTFVWCMNDTYRLEYDFITPGIESTPRKIKTNQFIATDMSDVDINALNEIFRYHLIPMTLGHVGEIHSIQKEAEQYGFQTYYEEVKSCIDY